MSTQPIRSTMLARSSIVALALLPSLVSAQQTEAARLVPAGPDQVLSAGNAVAVTGDWGFVAAQSPRGVFVFRRGIYGWELHQSIRGPVPAIGFATRLAASAETLVVGAFFEGAPGASHAGKVYLYERQGQYWGLVQELQPKGLREWDLFGGALAIAGDTLAIGANSTDLAGMPGAGAVHVYERAKDGHWTLSARLDYPGDYGLYTGGIAAMGLSVDVWGQTLVAGAENGVFVYEHGQKGWRRSGLLTYDVGKGFGRAVALAGRTIVVGHTEGPVWFDDPGSALVYEKGVVDPDEWTLVQEISASDGFVGFDFNDDFGRAVDIDGDRILVGASGAKFGDEQQIGAAYLFHRNPDGSWPRTETVKLVSSGAPEKEGVGGSVSMGSPFLLVGAIAAGPKGMNKGAGLLFELEQGESFCPANANSTGRAGHLAFLATAGGGEVDLLSVNSVIPDTAAFALAAPGRDAGLDQPFGQGRLCIGWRGMTRLPLVFSTGPAGAFQHTIAPGDPIGQVLVKGTSWSFQVLYRDDLQPGEKFFNTTNAVTVMLP